MHPYTCVHVHCGITLLSIGGTIVAASPTYGQGEFGEEFVQKNTRKGLRMMKTVNKYDFHVENTWKVLLTRILMYYIVRKTQLFF